MCELSFKSDYYEFFQTRYYIKLEYIKLKYIILN